MRAISAELEPTEQAFGTLAPAIRLGLERLEAALVIGHVRAVHRAQRYAHRPRCGG